MFEVPSIVLCLTILSSFGTQRAMSVADHDCLLVNSGPLASSLVPSVRIVPLHIFSCVVKRRERTKTETNRVLVSTVGSLLSSPVLSLLYTN